MLRAFNEWTHLPSETVRLGFLVAQVSHLAVDDVHPALPSFLLSSPFASLPFLKHLRAGAFRLE